ncbi:MAG: hypothetical protein AAF358_07860 [Pseudomonadota bacterium]
MDKDLFAHNPCESELVDIVDLALFAGRSPFEVFPKRSDWNAPFARDEDFNLGLDFEQKDSPL